MSKEGWRVFWGLADVLAIILIDGGLFCLESPSSLIEQDFKNIVSTKNGNCPCFKKTKRDLKKKVEKCCREFEEQIVTLMLNMKI